MPSSKKATPQGISTKGLDLGKYEAEGVDIGLLICSLQRTPTERAETNRAMLEFIEEAKRAREKISHAGP